MPWVPSTRSASVKNLPGCRVSLRTAQPAINTLSSNIVAWDLADYDTHGYWNPAVPTRITIPTGQGGVYLAGCNTDWSGVGGGDPSGWLLIEVRASNKTNPTLVGSYGNTTTITNPLHNCISLWSMSAGDYFTMFADGQNPTLDALSTNWDTGMFVVKVG